MTIQACRCIEILVFHLWDHNLPNGYQTLPPFFLHHNGDKVWSPLGRFWSHRWQTRIYKLPQTSLEFSNKIRSYVKCLRFWHTLNEEDVLLSPLRALKPLFYSRIFPTAMWFDRQNGQPNIWISEIVLKDFEQKYSDKSWMIASQNTPRCPWSARCKSLFCYIHD